MALWRRLVNFLWGTPMDRYEEAERKADEVIDEARELQRRLEPYTREGDPLGALMIDLYNRRQEVLHHRRASIR